MKFLPRKKLELPHKVSGRVVTNRGVHLQPFGFHGVFLDNRQYWLDLLVGMGISWVVILTEGDSCLEERHGTNPCKAFLDAGIIPIIRDKQIFPFPFVNVDTVRRTVELYARYGLRPIWQLYNEPFDNREWQNKQIPPEEEAWQIICREWSKGAAQVVEAGAIAGFPDGPVYTQNPFEKLKQYGSLETFEQGRAVYLGHHYGKNRHIHYPYDAVSRYGAPLTEEAYRRMLDDYADDPAWYDAPVELLNRQRRDWADPNLTAVADPVCWRGWDQIVHFSLETLGYVVPMALTEGGWVPRDRAGSGSDIDYRNPYTTPNMVAKKTLQMYDMPSPFFAICPWLLADEDLGGSGWPFDAWVGWAYSDKYGREKPVVDALKAVPPKEIAPRTEPMVLDVDGDTRDWDWVRQTYGARYRRGDSPWQLVEVHGYEGPPTLDVWAVDQDGLPVEGAEFYYYHPEAPRIEGDEWYDRGVLLSTDRDGRISFPAAGVPGDCRGAIWPKGKGDVLEGLGLLVGSGHKHVNGIWQMVIKRPVPPVEIGPEEPEEPEEPTPSWTMTVEYRPGSRIIAGTFPRAGIELTVTDPWGNTSTVIGGSKPEHGVGGFEVLAPHLATYTLSFLDQTFTLEMRDALAFVTFVEKTPTPKPPPESIPPRWQQVFATLDRIEELLERWLKP